MSLHTSVSFFRHPTAQGVAIFVEVEIVCLNGVFFFSNNPNHLTPTYSTPIVFFTNQRPRMYPLQMFCSYYCGISCLLLPPLDIT